MCIYRLKSESQDRPCMVESYYKSFLGSNPKLKYSLDLGKVPHDDFGNCILHSTNIDWKTANAYHKWLDIFWEMLRQFDSGNFEVKSHASFREIDMSGFCFVGKEEKLVSGDKERVLRIKQLKLKDYITLYLEDAKFIDTVFFEKCRIPKAVLIFKNASFEQELHFDNSQIFQVSLNDGVLGKGLMFNKCVFNGATEFCRLQAEGIFRIANTKFKTASYFNETIFDCEVFFDNNRFEGMADFSDCTFRNDTSIEECVFRKEVRFNNDRFESTLDLTGNIYRDNVYFVTSQGYNRMFLDKVSILLINPNLELKGQLIFDNVNFVNIVEEHRKVLMELSRRNKVSIGLGCIKYRIQTKAIDIPTNDINRNLISEIATSFTNYFISSAGTRLGVEFIEKSIHSLRLFYFTDEDITLEELNKRLTAAASSYWVFTVPKERPEDDRITAQVIDNYISKASIFSKIKLLVNFGLWSESDTEILLKAIPSKGTSIGHLTLVIQNSQLNMNIENVNAHAGSQVNIADRIGHVSYSPVLAGASPDAFEELKQLLLKLREPELQEITDDVQVIESGEYDFTLIEKLKLKIDQFCIENEATLVQSLTASAVYDVLKFIVLGK